MQRVACIAITLLLASCGGSGGDGGGATPSPNPPSLALFAGTAEGAGDADGPAPLARFASTCGITRHAGGTLYISDCGNQNIRKVTPDGIVSTLAGVLRSRGGEDGPPGTARFDIPADVEVDAAGTLYVADTFNNAIRKIDSAGNVTTFARVQQPSGIALDAQGRILAAENNTIVRIASDGSKTVIAGSPGVPGSIDGPPGTARIGFPTDLVTDPEGNIFFAEQSTVRRLSPAGEVLTVAGEPGAFAFADGVGRAARFNSLRGITIDATGSLFVADSGNAAVRRIAPDGTVSSVARIEGQGLLAGIRSVDGSTLYVAKGSTIRQVTTAGVVTTLLGSQSPVAGAVTVNAMAVDSAGVLHGAAFNQVLRITQEAASPRVLDFGGDRPFSYLGGIAFGADGSAYVSDQTLPLPGPGSCGAAVRRISPSGRVTLLAGSLTACGSTDGPALDARFLALARVAVDNAGNVYVLSGNAVRKISPGGVVSTLAGSAEAAGYADGNGTGARFNSPRGIAIDAQGNALVADTGNHVIRRVAPDGSVSTLAGAAGMASWRDGSGPEARFFFPGDITVDAAGVLYVAENNSIVRMITPDGHATTIVGVPSRFGFVPGPLPGLLLGSMSLGVSGSDLYVGMAGGVVVVRNRPQGARGG